MLGEYFYHSIFRKSILAFGTVFNNIVIKRTDSTGKLNSIKVPCKYGPKQKFLPAVAAEPGAGRHPTQISLPAMSFEIKGLAYDQSRKVVPTQFAKTRPPSGTDENGRPVQYKQYMPVPYNLELELVIISKNQGDGLQILEQILPNFHPSMNVSIEVIDTTKEERDIAMVLNGVGYQDDYEGDFKTRRTLQWTLNFTVMTYLFGPISAQRDIRKVKLDYRTDFKSRPAELRYTAEVASTDDPAIPRDEIDPSTDNYKVVETYEDVYAADNTFFGLD